MRDVHPSFLYSAQWLTYLIEVLVELKKMRGSAKFAESFETPWGLPQRRWLCSRWSLAGSRGRKMDLSSFDHRQLESRPRFQSSTIERFDGFLCQCPTDGAFYPMEMRRGKCLPIDQFEGIWIWEWKNTKCIKLLKASITAASCSTSEKSHFRRLTKIESCGQLTHRYKS